MSSPTICVENVSKLYRIGVRQSVNYRTIRETITEALSSPFRRLFSGNGHVSDEETADSTIWALKDVSFEVRRGEAIGIIGRNGAGKSTLLKILSRITEPTTGRLAISGRVSSLLEVGTGFHAELTGRENIYLNGAILGMSRREIQRKFDEIVAFAGIDRFLDTPVKRYSSGMYVRLAFAVAAHLEPEILIIDEVLAVGDAAFQKKCLGKMQDVASHGRTVLFVSHNLRAVRQFCSRGILIDQGKITLDAPINDTISAYNQSLREPVSLENRSISDRADRTSGAVRFTKVLAQDEQGNVKWSFRKGETLCIAFSFKALEDVPSLGFYLALTSTMSGERLTTFKETLSPTTVAAGATATALFTMPHVSLRPGEYALRIDLSNAGYSKAFDVVDENVSLPCIVITGSEDDPHLNQGFVSLPYSIKVHGLSCN